ncbi:hypothetical protein PG984_013872 [Apiospora sp. TS-2023a]
MSASRGNTDAVPEGASIVYQQIFAKWEDAVEDGDARCVTERHDHSFIVAFVSGFQTKLKGANLVASTCSQHSGGTCIFQVQRAFYRAQKNAQHFHVALRGGSFDWVAEYRPVLS